MLQRLRRVAAAALEQLEVPTPPWLRGDPPLVSSLALLCFAHLTVLPSILVKEGTLPPHRPLHSPVHDRPHLLQKWITDPEANDGLWRSAFTAECPRAVLGASVVLCVNPRLVPAGLSSVRRKDPASLLDGSVLLAAHRQGPPAVQTKVAFRNLGLTGKNSADQRQRGKTDEEAPLIGFAPVRRLLRILRREFGHIALFFWNAMEGDEIYIVWRPAFFLPQPFRATGEAHRARISKDTDPGGPAFSVPDVPGILGAIHHRSEGVLEAPPRFLGATYTSSPIGRRP